MLDSGVLSGLFVPVRMVASISMVPRRASSVTFRGSVTKGVLQEAGCEKAGKGRFTAPLFAGKENAAAAWLYCIERERKSGVFMADKIAESHVAKPLIGSLKFVDSCPISSNGSLFILCRKASCAASRYRHWL